MKKQPEEKENKTGFSLEEVLKIPHGVVQHYAAPLEDRKANLTLVTTDWMGIVDGIMTIEHQTKPLRHFNDKPFVELNFILEGNINQTHEGLLNNYILTKGYHNILFNPNSIESNEFIGIGTHRIFSVHILPEKMIGLFSGYIPEFAHLAEKIEKGTPFVLHAPKNGFAPNLKYFFDTIWQCPLSTGLGKLYFESKVLDLLCKQCEALIIKDANYRDAISKKDMDKVYHAREILLSNLSEPLSLSELSRLCGLNEFKLKKYFKEVFHISTFGLVREQRLEEAKRLIYQGEKNISEIAYELGYAHPQHFHREFKRQFGITPKALLQ